MLELKRLLRVIVKGYISSIVRIAASDGLLGFLLDLPVVKCISTTPQTLHAVTASDQWFEATCQEHLPNIQCKRFRGFSLSSPRVTCSTQLGQRTRNLARRTHNLQSRHIDTGPVCTHGFQRSGSYTRFRAQRHRLTLVRHKTPKVTGHVFRTMFHKTRPMAARPLISGHGRASNSCTLALIQLSMSASNA